MRPKKRILLIDPEEYRQSVTRFVLEQHGLFVLSASSIHMAAEIGHGDIYAPDLLLGYAPLDWNYLDEVAFGLRCASLFIHPQPGASCAVWPTMSEVLESIKVRTARKRGPRKKPPVSVDLRCEPIKITG